MWILRVTTWLYCFLSDAVDAYIYQSLQPWFYHLSVASRSNWTQWKHVKAQGESSHSTRPDFTVGLLWILTMLILPGAQLGSVVTHLNHPQILPQAMTMCLLLLRMQWEWELQEHVQHNPSVSGMLLNFGRLTQDTVMSSFSECTPPWPISLLYLDRKGTL